MICGCVVAIIQYTRCRVHRTDNTQTQWNSHPSASCGM
jgi:hypothetical protein